MDTLSNVQLEYQVIQTILELVPIVIEDCRSMVRDLVTNSVSPDLSADLISSGNFSILSLQNVQTSVFSFDGNYSIVYDVPTFSPKFDLYRTTFLPFYMDGSSTCYTLYTVPVVTAVNNEGENFEYSSKDCTMDRGTAICASRQLQVYRIAFSCAAAIVRSQAQEIPAVCFETAKVLRCHRQSFMRTSNQVIIFSQKEDNMTISCGSDRFFEPLGAGTTRIAGGCQITTSELTIYGQPSITSNEHALSSDSIEATVFDLFGTMSDLQVVKGIDLRNMTKDLDDFLTAEGKESVDLTQVQTQLKKFRTVHKLANYIYHLWF
jgi:hypothetical protein